MKVATLPRWEMLAAILLALVVVGVPAAAFAYNSYLGSPVAQEITIVGSGQRWSPHTIQVQVGQPVRLRLTSHDVVHGFLLQGQEQDYLVYPGKVTIVEFTPAETGTLSFVCTIYCGANHPTMAGQIFVGEIPPTPTPGPTPVLSPLAQRGQRLADSQGCLTCHTTTGQATVAPTWGGLWGSQVTLGDGTTAVADEAYLTESIFEPNAKVVEGYVTGLMLSYQGMLSAEDVQAIIEYIKALE